ncbi:GNAT family N-acetyltransferase [Candidatus Formimonas warabiya]|uniref:N-acetyltransferase domain-containing protein n=1 Tax=Formimonas warabiya TaxID=1761012 RepID=A0A3G1KZJ6_FORW1|nr:GNAT family N-acetyltransferase [Candidatus Formimonas warabiya]ATW27963.1 hypothetical protein DCMF_27270 [Candidatus Formimonas warabiya]
MNVLIKQAGTDDINNITALTMRLHKEYAHTAGYYDWDEFENALRNYYASNFPNGSCYSFIALDDETAVGTAVVSCYYDCPTPHNPTGRSAVLTGMYILPAYRQKGVGFKLLEKIMSHTQSLGYLRVTLTATEEGKRLYSKFGFQPVEGEMRYRFRSV